MTTIVNNAPIEAFTFNGGECHVSIAGIPISESTRITAYLYSAADIMQLMMVVDAIRRENTETTIDLTIPYFPYGRQDRICNQGEAFSLSVMAKMINSLECNSVTVYDPHSPVTTDLLNNVIVISQAEILASSSLMVDIQEKQLTLVSPDAGAENKTREVAKASGLDVIFCTKTRDATNGRITATNIPEGVAGKPFIIIDDICDGGRTFTELAKALKNAGAGELYLYVTHGIFSKGLDVLKENFQHVFCYHTFLDKDAVEDDFLTILEDS